MFKQLAICFLFVTLAAAGLHAGWAAPPGSQNPGTANPTTSQRAIKQAATQSGSQTPQSQQPITVQVQAPIDATADEQARENLEIQRNLEWFTGVLAAVGVLQALCLIWTYLQIRKQAELMEHQSRSLIKQTILLKQSTRAAQISAKAAMGVAIPTLRLERFALTRQPGQVTGSVLESPATTIVVKNYGQSPAFVKAYDVMFTCEELPEEPVFNPHPYTWYQVLQETAIDPCAVLTLGEGKVSARGGISREDVQAVLKSQKSLTIYGYVRYGDIFGSPDRYLRFSKRLMEFPEEAGTEIFLDFGGYKYTGERESDDDPVELPDPKSI